MKTEILISCDDWENRVAVLEDGALAEIYFEREEKVIGSIYKGRVENVLPGMGACFVNIGLGRNAFLYVDDIMRDPINIGETEITDRRRGHTVSELLKVGSDVLVQIVKEPRGLKGARVSTNISLPGRYLVLMPTGRYSGVSSRIEDARERERLKQIMRRVRPEGMATIVRTAAQGVSEAELIADLGVQLRLWHGILESYKRSTAPALLHKDLNLVFKAVRDFLTSDVSAVYIDSKEQYDEIRSTMSLLGPQYIDRLKLVEGPGSLFAQRGIDEELQKLLKPKIPLPSGGHLVLEHTEALTVIDVNTGKFTGGRNLEDTIVRTNVEAAAEIARQVRLRDIGGIIVVDFIDMSHERSREQVIRTLTEALRRDRTRSTIQEFSNLGLLEFTRKRVGKDLAGQLRSDCPYCSGLGSVMSSETVAISALRKIRDRVTRNGIRKLDVVADAGVATQLLGWYRDEFEKLGRDHDVDIALYVEPQHHRENVVVEESRRMRALPVTGTLVDAELLPVRLPNPASGVAEVNGYLIEVKDAANATGQLVKLRLTGTEGNLVRAELAEPLPVAGRRRRGQRGRGKEIVAADAPIAPPAPSLREVATGANGFRDTEVQRPAARGRRSEAVAFSIADDDDQSVRVAAATAKSSPGEQRARRGRTDGGRAEGQGRGGRRRPAAATRGASSNPPALVVGGEGDIDYDDGDDGLAVSIPQATERQSRPAQREPSDGNAARRSRRRRGRGGRSRADRPEANRSDAQEPRDDMYDEDESIVIPRDDDDEDDMSAVVDPRQPAAGGRPAKRFGPVRQLYGRPLSFEELPKREERPRGPRRPAHSQSYRDREELDVIVAPKRPAAIRVDIQEGAPVRPKRPGEDERDRSDRRPRSGGRDRGRVAAPKPKREGPPFRQLYPPPDQESSLEDRGEDADSGSAKSEAKPPMGRQARGPLIRPSDAPPVPKGKVRQLYPPPSEPEDLSPVLEDAQSYEPVLDERDEASDSVFVSSPEELEERRRRARERAQSRREPPQHDLGVSSSDRGETRANEPAESTSENDEWPAF